MFNLELLLKKKNIVKIKLFDEHYHFFFKLNII